MVYEGERVYGFVSRPTVGLISRLFDANKHCVSFNPL